MEPTEGFKQRNTILKFAYLLYYFIYFTEYLKYFPIK